MFGRGLWKALVLTTGAFFFLAAISYVRAADKLSAGEARRLIARAAGIELESGKVRVKEISPFGSSAVVVAEIETAFRLTRGEDGAWKVTGIRTGDRKWEDLDLLIRALNAEKTARAGAELDVLASALETFRRERGFYVEADNSVILVDHLSPRYLARVIREDPWQRPYGYEGKRGGYMLRSAGPDGLPGNGDDIVRTRNAL